MQAIRWRFGGLFWRLTMSYLMVTLIAALAIECAITLIPLLRDLQQANVSPLQTVEKQGATRIAPYMDNISTTSDAQALRYALAIPLFDEISHDDPRLTFVAILNQAGQPLTSTSCASSQLLSLGTQKCAQQTQQKLTTLQSYETTQRTIREITSPNRSSTQVIHSLPTGESLIAVSIQSHGKQTAVTLLVVINGPVVTQSARTIQLQQVISTLWHYWQPTGFYFIFLSTALGTSAGMLISHNLTRRLRRIAQATKEWSRGEFQMTIHDHAHDEVGQLSKDLNNMAEQLQMLLLTRRKLAIMEERTRLKRDLHDAVKQHLFAVQMQLSAVRVLFPKDANTSYRHLVEAEKLALLAQQELATLIEELRPAGLANKNLALAIEEMSHDWSRRTAIAIYVRIEQEHPLPVEIEQALFRVTQEALSNIARHSGARTVNLELLGQVHAITLTIKDDGHGFDLSVARQQKHSIGLRSMYERIKDVHGIFSLESTANGTSIKAYVPIPATATAIVAE
ncbi:hypothetical protein KSD_53830 [Ktedonobacter sp. SOSP1-85]|uniref:HAMP domain-containing sensor histidine kinase n=1 Tax=Ktedonobacter sp. SOSP1-85 TaxID=2778367 RepID=UPI00191538FB|nr:histidine kinase [Ktedonobacter sp. SOSP1-85]GHO77612.1 hypothetical protein KSD_53830 [Ktedonobacter sp. SOSP1-85]